MSLLEPLARALRISVPELLSGEQVVNSNRAANILRSALYVCPVCGNIIHASGAAVVSCCGVALPPPGGGAAGRIPQAAPGEL